MPTKKDFIHTPLPFFSLQVCCDYTCLVQGRHPGELGGAYWSANIVLAISATFVSVRVYYSSVDEDEVFQEEAKTWTVLGIAATIWALSVVLFARLMRRQYVCASKARASNVRSSAAMQTTCAQAQRAQATCAQAQRAQTTCCRSSASAVA